MRHSRRALYKMPKNAGVAPAFDAWPAAYEPWQHMRRVAKLVGTGFYIPPEWYNHFRLFPPVPHNFSQEQTLNPKNDSEETQSDARSIDDERQRLRDELSRRSRHVASHGMRYYNIFWVEKPLDRMERSYYVMRRTGYTHTDAVKKVLQEFYEEIAVKKRIAAIQAEEAKMHGGFLTMTEATVVLQVLQKIKAEEYTPHRAAEFAKSQRREAQSDAVFDAQVVRAIGEDKQQQQQQQQQCIDIKRV